MSAEYFFRNDDIRDCLDDSLRNIQELFNRRMVPIAHAIEPANVTPTVVDWLLKQKRAYPELLTLMQHGYDHTIKNVHKKGEFGGQRGYEEQYEDIRKGKELMNAYFDDLWFEAFNFPYAPYNREAIRALEKVGYKVLNSHYNVEWKRQIFYAIGHLMRRGILLDHHVSWNLKKYPGTSMYEISMNITFIKKYHDEQTNCEFFTLEEICRKIDSYLSTKFPIGLLLHHRYHTSHESIDLIEAVFDYLEARGIRPVSMETIYRRLASA